METKVSLGKKGIGYYLRLFLIAPFYFLADSSTRSPWDIVKSRCINHKCQWEEKPYETTDYTYDIVHYHACKHYGCNFVHPVTVRTQQGIELDEMMKKIRQIKI